MGVMAQIKGAMDGAVLRITSNQAARAATVPLPPGDWSRAEVEQKKSLVQRVADSAGSPDLTTATATAAAPEDFYIGAAAGTIRWITEVRLIHHDSNMKLDSNELRRFGSSAASPGLTNGVRLIVQQNGQETEVFTPSGVKNIGDYYRYAETVTGITDGISAGVDFLAIRMCFTQPVGLYPGSQDKVIIRIQDDLSSMTLFETVAIGWHETL